MDSVIWYCFFIIIIYNDCFLASKIHFVIFDIYTHSICVWLCASSGYVAIAKDPATIATFQSTAISSLSFLCLTTCSLSDDRCMCFWTIHSHNLSELIMETVFTWFMQVMEAGSVLSVEMWDISRLLVHTSRLRVLQVGDRSCHCEDSQTSPPQTVHMGEDGRWEHEGMRLFDSSIHPVAFTDHLVAFIFHVTQTVKQIKKFTL